MTTLLPKRPRKLRPPCVECGSVKCRTTLSWSCWWRCNERALSEANYVRAKDATRTLRKAGIDLVLAPSYQKSDRFYTPAVALAEYKRGQVLGLSSKERWRCLELIAKMTGPTPETLRVRLEELRAFAALAGWRHTNRSWWPV